jgi:hypothetical protein
MTDELTSQDKTRLLGITDGKGKGNDYDREFYETMRQVSPLGVDEVDDRVRRAILRYISDGTGPASHEDNGGFVIMGFVHGYMVG